MPRYRHSGFSLLELMIAITIIGIVAAIALPGYRAYVETTYMSKVNAAYENAVRTAREEFAKRQTRASLGLPVSVPTTGEQWIKLFDKDGKATAPGGGPAYITLQESDNGNGQDNGKGKGKGKGKAPEPDPEPDTSDPDKTGAVVIDIGNNAKHVDIYRPAYLELKPFRARVSQDSVEFEEL